MENLLGNIFVCKIYIKAQKRACFCVFSPFSAALYPPPHYIIMVKGLLTRSVHGNTCTFCHSILTNVPLPLHLTAALRQGNRIPIDQVGKFRERKQLLDKILAKDAEEMRNTCSVSRDYRGIPFSVFI